MKLLSAIVPCYNEEENVPYFYEEFLKNQEFFEKNDLEFELWYIDDGSGDGTAEAVKKLIRKDARVHLLSFSRNFGKEAALYAGLQKAEGDYVACMDADLQDPPSLLPEMFESLSEGYDMAATRRVTRKGEPVIRSFFARMFYKLMKRISRAEMVDGARDFRLMTRQVVDAERKKGETKWSFWKLFIYSLEGITSFSTAPLAFAAFMGVCFCLLSFFLIIFTIVRKAMFGDPTSGWPSLVCIISLISGVQLFCLGIVGQYLAKTYMEVKRRPIYLVKEEI